MREIFFNAAKYQSNSTIFFRDAINGKYGVFFSVGRSNISLSKATDEGWELINVSDQDYSKYLNEQNKRFADQTKEDIENAKKKSQA